MLLCLVAGAAGAMLRKAPEYPPKDGQNPICLSDTGKSCAGGCSAGSTCQDGKCICASKGCSDASGTCREAWNRWLEVEHRMAPIRTPNWFMAMEPEGKSAPKLKKGYPADTEPTGIWLFIEENDNKTMLIATKQDRYVTGLHFLDLPSPPWNATGFEAPIQRKILHAGQAEWVFEEALDYKERKGAKRIKHVASGRYLCVRNYKQVAVNKNIVPGSTKELVPELTSCAPATCEEHSNVFNIWPQNEHLLASI